MSGQLRLSASITVFLVLIIAVLINNGSILPAVVIGAMLVITLRVIYKINKDATK